MIINIKSAKSPDWRNFGNKAWQLNRMHHYGYSICGGYVLTPEFFDLFCKKNNFTIEDKELCSKISQGDFSKEMRLQLQKVFRDTSQRTGMAIVRSSALEEDGHQRTFAGIYRSIGEIGNFPDLLKAVKQVWCSYYENEAEQYQHQSSRSSTPVLIQEMMACQKSGVIFTRNPFTNKREYYVETSRGNNDKITAGQCEAVRYVFTDYGLPKDKKGILTGREMKILRKTSGELEKKLGFPCDLEWGMTGSRLFLFQARPVIWHANKDIYNKSPETSACILLDRYANPASVCYLSILDTWQSQIYLSFYHRYRSTERGEYPLCFFYNRVYWNQKYQKKYFEDDGRDRYHKKLRFAILTGCGYLSWYARLPGYYRKISCFNRELELIKNVSELASLLQKVLNFFCNYIGIDHYRFLGIAQILYKKLEGQLSDCGFSRQDVYRIIGRKTNQSKTVCVNQRLMEMAVKLNQDAGWKTFFLNNQEHIILKEMRFLRNQVAVFGEFWEFIREHGHRGIDCDDLYYPHWAEEPEHVVLLLKQYMRNDLNERSAETGKEPVIKGYRLKRCISLTGHYMCLRENQRYYFDKSWLLIRKILLRIADYYLEKKVIEDKQDIFHMTIDEIMDGIIYPCRLPEKKVILYRKMIFQKEQKKVPPYMLKENQHISVQRGKSHNSYKAMGVSSGNAKGKIRIIEDLNDLGQVKAGEIGVVRTFHPSWTPVLKVVSGLIMNYGNMLSHGSVVAREYGIPVVIFNGEARNFLTNGDRVEIDADRGRIYLLGKGEQEEERR